MPNSRLGPLARMDPPTRHLTLALGISLLLHVVVLSLHFRFPTVLAKVKENALDIILVNSKSAFRPVDPQARAQANLDGGGNTDEERRASTPLPPSVAVREGDDIVEAHRRVSTLENQQRQFMTRLKSRKVAASDSQRVEPTPPVETPPAVSGLDLANRALAIAKLEAQIDRQTDAYNKRPRKKFIGARTEEYVAAQYLEDWRLKIERIGNLNYPEAAKGRLYGSLVVYVEIDSKGDLLHAEIRRSSGHRLLDDAALRILNLSAPFARFPPELKRETDILAFARTWSFTRADELKSSAQ